MHTKGTWKVTEFDTLDGSKDWVVYIDGSRPDLPTQHIATMGIQHEEDRANARLIAAAPELLGIAEAYRNLLRTMAHTEGEVATFHHIETVLAKIKG